MKMVVKKTVVKKAAPKAVVAKKPVVKKAVAKKIVEKPAVKKAAVKAAPAKKTALSPEKRYQMIQDAAYYIAERHGFCGDNAHFWSLAEAEINAQLK